MKVCVNYNDARWRKYKIDFERVACAAAIDVAPGAEVSITLTNDAEIHALNKKYRDIDRPTNVLSFELGDDILLGDIYISLDTVLREAGEENIPVTDHVAHMVVHGMLHLQGYDHINDNDAKIMENTEVKILKQLGIKNPYVHDSAVCSDLSCCPGQKFLSRLHKLKIPTSGIVPGIIMFVLGVIATLGFAPFNMWWATMLAIAAAYKMATRSVPGGFWDVFWRTAPFGAAYAMAMFWWVLNSIYVVPELAEQFAVWTVPALVGIGIVGAVIFSVPFVVISCIRTFPACRPFLFAATWTFVLWLREWLLTGFPWNPIANIMLPYPVIANSMSLWGALGLTFVIIGLIAAVAEVLSNRRSKLSWGVLGLFVILAICGICAGRENIIQAAHENNSSPVIRVI